MYFNKQVRKANHKKLLECLKVFLCRARDFQYKTPVETNFDAPIDKQLEYAVGLRVMLNSNLAPDMGLANGSQGIIRDIIPEVGVNPPNPPKALVIEFENWTGDSFHGVKKN